MVKSINKAILLTCRLCHEKQLNNYKINKMQSLEKWVEKILINI